MRFMILVKATKDTEAGILPSDDTLMAEMATYHEELQKAGMLIDGSGLKPTGNGWRIRYDGQKRSFTDGPFTETKEILGGFWMLEVASFDDAVRWASEAPCPAGEMIEVRQVWEPEDFGPDIADKERQMIKDISAGKKG